MTRRAWNDVRWTVHERHAGRCAHCTTGPVYRFCVVKIGSSFALLCKSCTGKHLAPTVIAKRLATLRRGRPRTNQTSLPLEKAS